MAVQSALGTRLPLSQPQRRCSRPAARQPVHVRFSSSPTRPPPARPIRRPFSSPLPQQFQRLWALKKGKEATQQIHDQRAEGHLSWADGLEDHYRTGKTVGRGALSRYSVQRLGGLRSGPVYEAAASQHALAHKLCLTLAQVLSEPCGWRGPKRPASLWPSR